MATIKFEVPPPKKEDLARIAGEQGLTLPALSKRLAYMYLRDPLAYEKLFQELLGKQEPKRRADS